MCKYTLLHYMMILVLSNIQYSHQQQQEQAVLTSKATHGFRHVIQLHYMSMVGFLLHVRSRDNRIYFRVIDALIGGAIKKPPCDNVGHVTNI